MRGCHIDRAILGPRMPEPKTRAFYALADLVQIGSISQADWTTSEPANDWPLAEAIIQLQALGWDIDQTRLTYRQTGETVVRYTLAPHHSALAAAELEGLQQ